MIDINLIRENPELVKEGMRKKGANPEIVDNFLQIDFKWRVLKKKIDEARASQKLFNIKEREDARKLKESIVEDEKKIDILSKERGLLIGQIPNLPEDSVPVGKDDSENKILKIVGEPARFSFSLKDYISIADNFIDTERASKVAGSRFGYILGDLAEMSFALFLLGIDTLLPYGFRFVIPPVMLKPEIMRRMGKGKFIDGGDAFYIPEDDLYLVGSSEHSIAPMFADETISLEKPVRFLGFSACFRREAGSYGKDTRGILRVHQFNKLEMFVICRPEDSEKEHEFLLEKQEELMRKIELPYRVVVNSTGDMGFDASKQYDIEAWMPSQNKYRETHSCSNTTDFQSRGLNITYKKIDSFGKEKKEFVHTLNATAFSERPVLAILENFQQEDGRVMVPESIRKYLKKDFILSPNQF